MAKITTYPKITSFESGDIIFTDGSDGPRNVYARSALRAFTKSAVGWGTRRNAYFSENIGSEITSQMVDKIYDGTFEGFTVGQYFTFEDFTYIIADMNYYYGNFTNRRSSLAPEATPSADVIPAIGNHLVMIVRSSVSESMPTAPMNDTDTTEGGYIQSKMYTEYLDDIRAAIASSFGNLVIPFTQIYPNDAAGTTYSYVTDTVFPLSEVNMYGHNIFGRPDIFSYDNRQYSLFTLYPTYHSTRSFWLRDIVSSTEFAYHEGCGMNSKAPASTPGELVVAFLIGQATRE